ncbi:hypothetical protein CEXT_19951 [Caerostris extrusa]|uniref:Uncharacterized protein n=1 Tax=Caerostris extrusa TaxID=172846 RepID=A0AAV4VN28_CAEEX|nr:hypothetical protein CEXT_19951 [Caerostris extrusa]
MSAINGNYHRTESSRTGKRYAGSNERLERGKSEPSLDCEMDQGQLQPTSALCSQLNPNFPSRFNFRSSVYFGEERCRVKISLAQLTETATEQRILRTGKGRPALMRA